MPLTDYARLFPTKLLSETVNPNSCLKWALCVRTQIRSKGEHEAPALKLAPAVVLLSKPDSSRKHRCDWRSLPVLLRRMPTRQSSLWSGSLPSSSTRCANRHRAGRAGRRTQRRRTWAHDATGCGAANAICTTNCVGSTPQAIIENLVRADPLTIPLRRWDAVAGRFATLMT
jgi:hypothetical protein